MMGDPKSFSRQRYDRFAQNYVTSRTHAQGAELERLVALARPQPDWIVVDVATGGGHTALKFAPHVARVIATDIAPRMLAKAQAFVAGQGVENVAFELADAEDLPFEDGQFDLVTCRIAPHHFANPARFVQESARVLRPGGRLLVQDHLVPQDAATAHSVDTFERLRDPSHNRAFSQAGWQTMFQAAGLSVEGVEEVVKQHDFLPWAERQGCAPETIARLEAMLAQAAEPVRRWMQPENWGTPQATFVNRHIIIVGFRG
ncbi:MAG: class I SAM-dependent methyltransferase [Chloroflexota bacterium]